MNPLEAARAALALIAARGYHRERPVVELFETIVREHRGGS